MCSSSFVSIDFVLGTGYTIPPFILFLQENKGKFE